MESMQINTSQLAFPVSLILGTAFLIAIFSLSAFGSSTHIYKMLTSIKTTIVVTTIIVLLLIIEGITGMQIQRTWIFVLPALMFAFILGLVVLKRLSKRFDLGFTMNHTGLLIIAWAMIFGAADYREGRMMIYKGGSENLALMETGETMPLDFHIKLKDLLIDYYPDSITPRQFYSDLQINDKEIKVSVNSPGRYDGYMLYQSGYDTKNGQYIILQIVRDPWILIVWIGVAMLSLGALIMIFRKI